MDSEFNNHWYEYVDLGYPGNGDENEEEEGQQGQEEQERQEIVEEGDNDNEEESSNNTDSGLRGLHTYLGNNLEPLESTTWIVNDMLYGTLPFLSRNESIILFPGQVLPMRTFNVYTRNMLQDIINTHHMFGIFGTYDERELAFTGTIAEIYEYHRKPFELCFKAKGTKRYKRQGMFTEDENSTLVANIKALHEVVLGSPLFEQRLASLDNVRIHAANEEDLKKRERIDKFDAALSQWPTWVYRQYDTLRLVLKLRELLQFLEERGCTIPTDPTELSFWVAQNLLIEDKEKLAILNYDCPIERLRYEIDYLAQDREFVCSNCDVHIGYQADMFAITKEGPQGAYVNPSGAIHEAISLLHAEGLKLDRTHYSLDSSWFSGYGWIIASCEICGIHMGWKFIAANSTLEPHDFWLLTRKSLKTKKI